MNDNKVYYRSFFDLIGFQRRCLLCRGPTGSKRLLCPGCQRDLPWLELSCPQCADPLPQGSPQAACGRCLKHPPSFDRSLIPLRYEFPVNDLVHRLKQRARPNLLQLSSDLFLHQCHREIAAARPEVLVPIPLHRNRLYRRGYNQATEWARYLGKALRIPVAPELCTRVLNTPLQHELSAVQRRRNLRNAFTFGDLHGLTHVALIDDVMTTGSTLEVVAKGLKKEGVARVDAWCLARTPSHRLITV